MLTKREALRRQVAAYTSRHPERYEAWHQAMEAPQACQDCAADGRPLFGPGPPWVVVGWRCYECRQGNKKAPTGETR